MGAPSLSGSVRLLGGIYVAREGEGVPATMASAD